MRGLAALTRTGGARVATALLASVLLASLLALPLPAETLAEDPTAAPPAGAASCADRFPAEGPGGVDLRLGCIVGELVGAYTASSAEDPTPISFYFIALFAGIRRRAAARLAADARAVQASEAARGPGTPGVVVGLRPLPLRQSGRGHALLRLRRGAVGWRGDADQ